MFKRFHDHGEGSGAGLYMIKRMLENNGGGIFVESKEGEGSTLQSIFKQPIVAGLTEVHSQA